MINLLPEESKRELRSARTNVVLLRYNGITAVAVLLLFAACFIFYVILDQSKKLAEADNSANLAKAASFETTRKQAQEYTANLATAKNILKTNVNYTEIVFGITELLPSGVILDNLNLTAQDFGNQTLIAAHAKDYDAVEKLKQNFQSSKLFENVYFQSINRSENGDESAANYPIAVGISVKIKKVAQ